MSSHIRHFCVLLHIVDFSSKYTMKRQKQDKQTFQQEKERLEQIPHKHYAKKSLGQHFLRSAKAIQQMVDAAQLSAGELVVEIGPGEGVLTAALLAQGVRVIAIEKDTDLIPQLSERFASEIASGHLTLLTQDVMTFDPELLRTYGVHYKLVANIPYYITGAIIEQFLSTQHQPQTMVLLVQKEVAQRMAMVVPDSSGATKNTIKGSILSIVTQSYGQVKMVATVPAGAFVPAPQVDSAIIAMSYISRDFFADCDEALFLRVVKTLFGQKRRQVSGTLGALLKEVAVYSKSSDNGSGDDDSDSDDSSDNNSQITTNKDMVTTFKDVATALLQECDLVPTVRAEDISLIRWKKIVQKVVGFY